MRLLVLVVALALLLLILAFPSHSEDLPLDDDANLSTTRLTACGTGDKCHVNACEDNIDEDVDAAGDDELLNMVQALVFMIAMPFGTPSGNPVQTTDAQRTAVKLVREDGITDACAIQTDGGDPVITLTALCDGTSIKVGSATDITANDQIVNLLWTFNTTDCAADGSDVELSLTLARDCVPSPCRYIGIEAVMWDAALASGRNRIFLVQ